jgi:hypothetical protein
MRSDVMEDPVEDELRTRDGFFNLCYYFALTVLVIALVWHWIFGGRFSLGRVAICSAFAFIVLGLLNSLGLFGRR